MTCVVLAALADLSTPRYEVKVAGVQPYDPRYQTPPEVR